MMEAGIFQIKISLKNSKPNIWRRILVDRKTLLSDLHKIIQTTMGWENCHLHQFVKNNEFYSEPSEDDMMDSIDYRKLKIEDLLMDEKQKIVYEYDFGDGWEHDILLEKIIEKDPKLEYPICIKGKMCCPPEDCGGVWGYVGLLEVIKNPKHPEYEDMMEWLGDDFDPDVFDIDLVNELLLTEGYGCEGLR